MSKSFARRIILVVTVSLAAACAFPTAPATPPPNTPTSVSATATLAPIPTIQPSQQPNAGQVLDALLSDLAAKHLFAGSVLVARGGTVLLSKGYGLADQAQGLADTPHTKFHLASMTKAFTAMAIMILENQGKLDVHASVCKYMPDCPPAWKPITIHHLLTHTSGLPDYFPGIHFSLDVATPPPLEEPIRIIRDQPLDFAPGTKEVYSNSGYYLLGYLIEQISGQTYGDFLRQNIFKPLGMADSGYYDGNADGLAIGYSDATTPMVPIAWSALYSAGALYSTVEDMYRWDQALYTEKLVPQGSLDRIFTPYTPFNADYDQGGPNYGYGDDGYGYGWAIGTSNGHRVIHHMGIWPGGQTHIARYVDDGLVIVVLSNYAVINTFEVAKLLAGKVLQP
jgi:CubicO group peptidase (beta-lactamase class C family)